MLMVETEFLRPNFWNFYEGKVFELKESDLLDLRILSGVKKFD